jgi:transcription elongation factor Elf1
MTSPTEVGDPAQGLVNCPRCGDPLLCICLDRRQDRWLRVCEACRPPGPRRTNPALEPKPVVPRDVCVATVDRCG